MPTLVRRFLTFDTPFSSISRLFKLIALCNEYSAYSTPQGPVCQHRNEGTDGLERNWPDRGSCQNYLPRTTDDLQAKLTRPQALIEME